MSKKNTLPKRVLAIHDICGVGRCSLVSVISLLSHLGHSVCPLATATFSVNTSYPDFQWQDLSPTLLPFIEDYWKKGIHFDSLYSGYLGSEKQIEAILKASNLWQDSYKVIDPVFADQGSLYPHFDMGIVESFRILIKEATLITPNVTEASYLLTSKPDQIRSLKDAEEALISLSNDRRTNVLLTSVEDEKYKDKIGIIAFDKETGNRYSFFSHKRTGANFCGTGDTLTTTLLGLLLSGKSFENSLIRSFDFINNAIDYTLNLKGNVREGIIFEPCLKNLS